MRILITGGAGFVGSSLAFAYRAKYPESAIVVLDNLRRRGSEINLALFKRHAIDFQHGDIRNASDLDDLHDNFDLMIEASAEPSVSAGLSGSPAYVIDTNLSGTLNCLEFVRKRVDSLVFLSTSRVYSIAPLREIKLIDRPTRFEIAPEQVIPGVGQDGISESFPTHLPRSFYGATKLASEMFIQEYVSSYGIKAVVNRCGVIAGPGQFGKVDQGVFTWWVAAHHFGKPLRFTGFGGTGKQVRDLLHPLDLFSLLERQTEAMERASGATFNVGGGRDISVSLLEYTEMCQTVSGRAVAVEPDLTTTSVDIPLYLSDCRSASEEFGWKPAITATQIVSEINGWIRENEAELLAIFT